MKNDLHNTTFPEADLSVVDSSGQETSDETLMMSYASGDFKAFEALYARNKGGVYRYLSRQIHDRSLVDDLFQEVWSKVIANASSYRVSAKFTTWLYTIARNKVIDHIRHIKTVSKYIDEQGEALDTDSTESCHITLSGMASSGSASSGGFSSGMASNGSTSNNAPDIAAEQSQQSIAIVTCMGKLPTHHLDSFLLKEEGGLSAKQIADIVYISLEASKSRLKTAYRLLRECLGKTLVDETAYSTPVGYSQTNGKAKRTGKSGPGENL